MHSIYFLNEDYRNKVEYPFSISDHVKVELFSDVRIRVTKPLELFLSFHDAEITFASYGQKAIEVRVNENAVGILPSSTKLAKALKKYDQEEGYSYIANITKWDCKNNFVFISCCIYKKEDYNDYISLGIFEIRNYYDPEYWNKRRGEHFSFYSDYKDDEDEGRYSPLYIVSGIGEITGCDDRALANAISKNCFAIIRAADKKMVRVEIFEKKVDAI